MRQHRENGCRETSPEAERQTRSCCSGLGANEGGLNCCAMGTFEKCLNVKWRRKWTAGEFKSEGSSLDKWVDDRWRVNYLGQVGKSGE